MGGDRARNARWEFLPRMRDRLREEERLSWGSKNGSKKRRRKEKGGDLLVPLTPPLALGKKRERNTLLPPTSAHMVEKERWKTHMHVLAEEGAGQKVRRCA